MSCILQWKKDPKDKTTRRAHENDNWSNKFLEIVGEVRKKSSIATAELSIIKGNWKLTKREKKNRFSLQKGWRSLSASSLVSCIEKQKSLLRELKVSFGKKKRQEEAKVLEKTLGWEGDWGWKCRMAQGYRVGD